MRKLVISLLWLFSIIGYGQSLKVISFETAMFDIAASTNPRYDINGKIGSLIKVQLPEEGAKFESSMILGDVDYDSGEYKVYVATGTKRLTVKFPKCMPITIDFSEYGVNATESKTTYVMQIMVERTEISKFKKNCFYLEPKMQIGGMTAVGASIGGYKGHLNVELSYIMGLNESEEIYWNSTSTTGENVANSYTYKPNRIDGKVGYAFYLGKPFRVTPQVGIGVVSLKGTEKQDGNGEIDAINGYAISAIVSGRIDYLILPWLGVGVSPEYSLALSKSDLFERVSDVSTKVKGFATGLNVKIGVYVTF